VVIESDGQASIERVRQTIGNHGLYGCAICEQIHRLPVAACPLSMVTRRNVLLDPCEMVAGEMVLLAAVESSPERRKGAS
jgi:hypothetical protein